MSYNPTLVERISNILTGQNVRFTTKNMFGGVAFMVRNKMCLGVTNDDLMVRFDPDLEETALGKKGAREMDFTGRPMKGYVFVDPTGTDTIARLRYWVDLALAFNPQAKRSKKRLPSGSKGRRS